jgi:hypothetical protein
MKSNLSSAIASEIIPKTQAPDDSYSGVREFRHGFEDINYCSSSDLQFSKGRRRHGRDERMLYKQLDGDSNI